MAASPTPPSSSRIRAPCLVTAGLISITVTWVLSSFSPAAFTPDLPHFGVRPAYLPLPSHTDSLLTGRWLSSFSLLSLPSLHCRKQQGCSPPPCPRYRRRIPAVTVNENPLGVTSGLSFRGKNNKQTMSVSVICSLRGGLDFWHRHTWPG